MDFETLAFAALCALQCALAMQPIRVFVGDGPRLTREIITSAVKAEPGMKLVDPSDDAELRKAADSGSFDADVVVVLLHNATNASADAAVSRAMPTRAVVAVDSQGGSVWIYDYELRRSGKVAGEVTTDTVASAIRGAAKHMGIGLSTTGRSTTEP
jgi:hypothetical protein